MKSSFKNLIYLFLFLVLLGLAVWAFYIEPSRLVVNNYPLKLKNGRLNKTD